jgi:hypothetical protein
MTMRRSLVWGSLCSLLLSVASSGAHAQARPRAKVSHKSTAATPAPEPGRSASPEPAVSAVAHDVPVQAPAAAPSPSSVAETPAAAPAASATEPSAPQAPPTAVPPAGDDGELASLQQDMAQVMDDLVQARARVAVLGKALFKTRVRVKLDNRAAPDQTAVRLGLWLDGAPIWSGDGSALRDAERALFDGFAAPGAHLLTVEVEQRARQDEAFRYTLHESYRFMVVAEKRTDLKLVLDDDSDMAEDFPDDHEGEYDVRTRLQVRAVGLNEE